MPRTIIFFLYSFPRIWYSIHFHLQKNIILYIFLCVEFFSEIIHNSSTGVRSFLLSISVSLIWFLFFIFFPFFHINMYAIWWWRSYLMTSHECLVFLFLRHFQECWNIWRWQKYRLNINCYFQYQRPVALCWQFLRIFFWCAKKYSRIKNNNNFWEAAAKKHLFSSILGQVR